jgi:hypothetical protein
MCVFLASICVGLIIRLIEGAALFAFARQHASDEGTQACPAAKPQSKADACAV